MTQPRPTTATPIDEHIGCLFRHEHRWPACYDEAAAAPPRYAPAQPIEPRPVDLLRRAPAIAYYRDKPTSHLSEELLWRAYGLEPTDDPAR